MRRASPSPTCALFAVLVACQGDDRPEARGTPDGDLDGYAQDVDCDDANAHIHPDAAEVPYDGLDNDCSPATPDDDLDGDGVLVASDCDDTDPRRSPDEPEVCDGIDNDCDADLDEPDAVDAVDWYRDEDGDGYGDTDRAMHGCDGPPGSVAVGGDCDDTRAALDLADADGDGFSTCDADCDDADATANPADADGDGVDSCSGDCDDAAAAVAPGAPDPFGDGVDTNCDSVDGVAPTVWVADRYSGEVFSVNRLTGAATVAWSGLGDMIGIARAPDGRMWVSRWLAGTVAQLDPGGGFTDVFTGLVGPHALNWDPATETLLLADPGNSHVVELDPATGSLTVVATGLIDPISAVRFPGSSEVWIAQRGSPQILVADAGGTRVGAVLPLYWGADTLVISDGALYAAGQFSPVYRIDPVTGVVTEWVPQAAPGATVSQICLDPHGPGLLATVNYQSSVTVLDGLAAPTVLTTQIQSPWQCVGDLPVDGDGDGFFAARVGGDDCDDQDPAVYPGAGC